MACVSGTGAAQRRAITGRGPYLLSWMLPCQPHGVARPRRMAFRSVMATGASVTTFRAYARYYDLMYREKPYSAEAAYVVDLALRHGCSVESLLELGVGTGGHAVHFLDLARRVDGVDVSTEMLVAAEARRRTLPQTSADRLSLHHGDVRDVRLNRRFSLIVSMFHVMSYQCRNEHIMAAFGPLVSIWIVVDCSFSIYGTGQGC